MDYKTEIIKMVERMKNESRLKFLYEIVKAFLEKES